MGQKINPVSLRLQTTNRNFDSSWYSDYFYKKLITKDIFLHYYLNSFLKLLKLPTGRYSIQHLQKKTQVFNFLHYSKSTREWRAKLFGLTKRNNFSKKKRYFFKNSLNLGYFNPKSKTSKTFNQIQNSKKRVTKKLKLFYTSLNQLGIYKIQKKITGFQNLTLWSNLNGFGPVPKKTFGSISQKNLLVPKKNLIPKISFFEKEKPLKDSFFHFKNVSSSFLKKKINKLEYSKSFELFSTKQITNSNLVFLQNLFVYKTLKSTLKEKKTQLEKLSLKNLDYKYRNYLESSLSSLYKFQLDLVAFKVKTDWQCASYLADEIVYFLEKRIPFRRLKSKILKQLSKISTIRGVRITCSGRVGGKSKKAQRAKIECIKHGQTSLHVFSSRIDFSCKTARTSFGSVGVKVWICYN